MAPKLCQNAGVPKDYSKLNVQIPAGLKEQIEAFCEEKNISQAAFTRLAFHEYLDRHARRSPTDLNSIATLLSEDAPVKAKADVLRQLLRGFVG